jgi:type II secretory pathway component PulC
MGLRKIEFALWVCVIAFSAAAAFVIVAAARTSLASVAVQTTTVRLAPLATTQDSKAPPLADFQRLLTRNLRQPLYDPAAVSTPPIPAPAKPSLDVKLAGTIIEPGHSKAMLITRDGKTELKGVGQKCGEAEILAIDEKRVVIRFNGDAVELRVPAQERGR